MANLPCPTAERHCFPCAGDSSNPLANLSLEPADRNIFLSVNFRTQPNPPLNNWNQVSCVGFCESSVSQEAADDCAAKAALECIVNHDPPPNPDNPSWGLLFCNQEQLCQNGSDCYTQPACSVAAFSVAEANSIAESLCNHRVNDPDLVQACPPPAPPPPPPELFCPQESGAAAPNSLEIASSTNWGSFTYATTGTWSAAPSYNIMQLAKDHPPGEYRMDTTSGFRYRSSDPGTDCDFLCNPCTAAMRHLEGLWDDSNNITTGSNYLTNNSTKDFNAACYNSIAEAAADFNTGIKPWPIGNSHSNTKSPFYVATNTGYVWSLNSGSAPYFSQTLHSETVFSIVQQSGLIPQPRKLRITNYSSLVFADPVGAASWNGQFNTRDSYSAGDLRWDAPASGFFGGARLKYTMAHPTSANGKGWQLDILSTGMILLWRGFKAVGSTPIGRYYKDSTSTTVGPNCVSCEDASDDQWFP